MLSKLTGPEAMKFINQLDPVFANLPHLPKGIVDFLVNIAPWLAGLGGVLSILGGLSSLSSSGGRGLGLVMQYYTNLNPMYFVLTGVLEILVGVLLLMAFNPLKERQLKGWIYLFWTSILNIAQIALGIIFFGSGIVGGVVGVLIGLYIMFEMKPAYDGKLVAKVKKIAEK